jgi:murein DD-endopeptidase MepM/ murein hydrolase activator NlpD
MISRTVLAGLFIFSLVPACYSGTLPPNFAAPAGELEPSSGTGRHDETVFFPRIRFPLEQGPAFLNSQVYRPGGDHGGSGDQCASENYSYPWRDNFCEDRSWPVAMCPAGRGHQGQDIRPSTCKKDVYWAVAVDDGVIAHVGTYSVTLQAANGVIFRYLHINMDQLAVGELDKVTKGQRIGKVSNYFGSTTTTVHLHFDAKGTVLVGDKRVISYLPPYTSLISSYKTMMEH